MKKVFTLVLLAISFNSYSQKLSDRDRDKIEMHLIKYQDQQRDGKAFAITGLAIGLAGAIIGQGTGKDKDEFASALGMIGATFSAYGIVRVFDSGRHLKKAHWYSSTAAQK